MSAMASSIGFLYPVFKGGIEIGIQQYLLIFMPIGAHEECKCMIPSVKYGSVRTEYIHTTEVLNGGQPLDDDLLLCIRLAPWTG